MKYYRYCRYDLWLTPDGWEVNDVYQTDIIIALPTDEEKITDKELARIIRRSIDPKSRMHIKLEWSWDEEFPIHINAARDGRPLCELRPLYPEEVDRILRGDEDEPWNNPVIIFDKVCKKLLKEKFKELKAKRNNIF